MLNTCSRPAAPIGLFCNPIVPAAPPAGAADPSVVFHGGFFHSCRSIDDRSIGIARARRLPLPEPCGVQTTERPETVNG